MKKILLSLILVALPVVAFSQANITTKKLKIADATSKTVKVVLTGNPLFDETMKEEMMMRWHLSPFEFCTVAEFEALKKSPDYYFLLNMKSQFKKEDEPGLNFLCLVKGGPKAGEGVSGMLEVVSVPFCPSENASGRELVFLPAFLDIIQDYVLSAMETDKDGYGGLAAFSSGLWKTGAIDLLMSEEDMSEEVMNINFPEYNIIPVNDDEGYRRMQDNAPETLVTYCIAPDGAKPGSYCYKYIIDSGSHKLHWFKKHKITKKTGPGFQLKDVALIREERRY